MFWKAVFFIIKTLPLEWLENEQKLSCWQSVCDILSNIIRNIHLWNVKKDPKTNCFISSQNHWYPLSYVSGQGKKLQNSCWSKRAFTTKPKAISEFTTIDLFLNPEEATRRKSWLELRRGWSGICSVFCPVDSSSTALLTAPRGNRLYKTVPKQLRVLCIILHFVLIVLKIWI